MVNLQVYHAALFIVMMSVTLLQYVNKMRALTFNREENMVIYLYMSVSGGDLLAEYTEHKIKGGRQCPGFRRP